MFMVLWFTFSYAPIAHMVWFWMGPDAYASKDVVDAMTGKAGMIWQWGALDFAGGTVVHINAAVAGLVGAYMVGKRIGYGKEAMAPHSLTLTMVGACAAVGGLVRLQRRLRPGSQRLRCPGLHQHLWRHCCSRADLVHR
jgi:ammonia channel protein AmtB